jgi:integrase
MCEHEKKYREDIMLPSYPPKYLWECKKCGKKGYDSRNNGADLADVQQILGHENPSTTLIYAQVSEERKKQAHKRYHVQ